MNISTPSNSTIRRVAAFLASACMIALLAVPSLASAASLTAWKIGQPIMPKCSGIGPVTFHGQPGSTMPCGFKDLMQLGVNLMGFSIYIMTICAVLAIVYAGWLLMSSGGDSKKRSEAKALMTKVVIGIFVTLGAWLIVHQIGVWLGVGSAFTMV